MAVQSQQELDEFYISDDPWGFDKHQDDLRRKRELLSILPSNQYDRTLDVGCGNGFITLELPGREVVGVDLSDQATRWACNRATERPDRQRFRFEARSLFDLSSHYLGRFDLIIMTGVLYPQYIGRGFSVAREIIDDLLLPGGHLVSCQILEWLNHRLPYTSIETVIYPYREYHHRLEVLLK